MTTDPALEGTPAVATARVAAQPSTRLLPVAWSLRGLMVGTGFIVASLAPFSTVILAADGMDPAAIGVVLALSAAAAIWIVPAFGHLADVRIGRRRALALAIVLGDLAGLILLLSIPLALVAILVASFGVFIALWMGLTDALAIAALPDAERQYGALRALSSLAFAVGVVAAGFVYNHSGYGAAPLVLLGSSAVLALALWRVPDATSDPAVRGAAMAHAAAAPGRFGSVGQAFRLQPRLLGVLVTVAVAYTGLQAALTFVGLRIVDLGGQPSDVALSFGISAVMEIPGLLAAGWLARRFGLRAVFVGALMVWAACVASWGLLSSPDAINATRLLTGLAYGSLWAARVLVIARLLPGPLQATGQTLIQATTLGLSNVLGDILGGALYGSAGATPLFLISAGLTVVGGAGAWYVLRGPLGGRETMVATGTESNGAPDGAPQ